ncbi:Type II secretion system protein D [Pandoraea morbifera]|uniref:Type II secretion system protein D n=1 Tax=Pandoraea morbifera TaxID=2508300 RepID=A0A5E4TAZ5_9BURK|nr:secretin N-terminal domain-containing protein [Pandoraea morbifera]VVD85105.1 Type II secretion system protein D [Pandoraea morbifera]
MFAATGSPNGARCRPATRWLARLGVLCLFPVLGACAVPNALSESDVDVRKGDLAGAVTRLAEHVRDDPQSIALRTRYLLLREQLTAQYLRNAGDALTRGDDTEARHWLTQTLRFDAANQAAAQWLDRLRMRDRLRGSLADAQGMASSDPRAALRIVSRVLRQQPDWGEATALADRLRSALDSAPSPASTSAAVLRKPVSLHIKSRPVPEILEMISQVTGINFVLDGDLDRAARASLDATQTTAGDVVDLLLSTNGLEKQFLNANTLLIFPATAEKLAQHRSLAVQTFFLSYADVKKAAAQVRQLMRARNLFVDERLGAITVRDSAEALDAIARMIDVIDLPTSEVTLDVQVLEVSNDGLLDLGVRYPESVSLHFADAVRDAGGGVALSRLGRLSGDAVDLDVASPLARLNLLQETNKAQILANPRIRVRNREKATISIGERVPVVSTTNLNGAVTESLTYQDVGLKLDVEPSISLNDEIVIKVALDVSNITRQVQTKTGLIAYNLSARTAKTTLSARNNETQVLAGLINREAREKMSGIPGLSQMPLLGRLFGSRSEDHAKTEVVLLITPHVERSLAVPASRVSRFESGTEQHPGDTLRLGPTTHMVISNAPSGAAVSSGRPSGIAPPDVAADALSDAFPSRSSSHTWRQMPAASSSGGSEPARSPRESSPESAAQYPADSGFPSSPEDRDDPPRVFGGKVVGPKVDDK